MDETLVRITTLMKEQKIQDQEMIEYLGLKRGTFSNWRRDKEKSYYENIDRIADRLGVSIDFLIRGNEIETDSLSRNEMELVECYRQLSDDAKDIVLKNARLLSCS